MHMMILMIALKIHPQPTVLKFHENMGFRVKVFNATFNNISIISWLSVLLVKETREPGENH
jgi:hypothetical protein